MASHKMTVETETSIVNYEYEWKIKNFLKYYAKVRGEEFSPLKSLPLKYVVELEPRLHRDDGHKGYKLSLIKLSKEKIPETCRVSISVKINNGPIYCSTITAMSENSKSFVLDSMDSICLVNGYLQESTTNLFANNVYIYANTEYLTFLCTFTFFGYNVTTVSDTNPVLQTPHERYSSICSRLKTLYESKTESDITFEIGDNTIKAHRCILVAQSPVFKRMLENNLAESESNCIQITDFDISVYDCFLKFLYCGDIEDTSFDIVTDLFALADKYSVDGLTKDCREILAKSLTVETVCKVFILSYLHSDETLKDKSMQFINHHFSLIKEKTEWKKLVDDYPKLASEFYNYMSINLG